MTVLIKRNLFQSIRGFIPLNKAQLFSLATIADETDIWTVIALSAFLGVLYGVLVHPVWASEAIEFAQAWAGLVDYQKSSWGTIMFADPSLQITIPALLLLAGFQYWSLCIGATAFFCALSFSAIASASFVFTRNILVSTLIPLLLLSYHFVNSHGYTVIYPVASSQFGQTGQYMALLGLSILACEWPIAAGIIGGILSGVHAVWCVCFVLAAFPITWWLYRQFFKKLTQAFIISCIASLFFLYLGNSLMPEKQKYQPPSVPKVSTEDKSQKEILVSIPKKPENTIKLVVQSKQRIRSASHNVLFSDSPSFLWAAFTFFLPTVFFIILSLSIISLNMTIPMQLGQFVYAKRFLAMVSVPIFLIIVYKFIEEFDPLFSSLQFWDARLPTLVLRAIFNRWMNLTTLLLPIMLVSILFNFVRDKKSWLMLGVSTILLFMFTKKQWYLIPAQPADNVWLLPKAYLLPMESSDYSWFFSSFYFFIAFLILLFLARRKYKQEYISLAKILPIAGIIFFFSVTFISLANHAYTNIVDGRFSHTDVYDPIVSAAKMDKGPLIISPGVLGNFYPQLRTGRAMILPSDLEIYDTAFKSNIQVYCYINANVPLPKFYEEVRPCFEKRTPREWKLIAKGSTAGGMITPDFWNLKIKPVANGGGLAYYRF